MQSVGFTCFYFARSSYCCINYFGKFMHAGKREIVKSALCRPGLFTNCFVHSRFPPPSSSFCSYCLRWDVLDAMHFLVKRSRAQQQRKNAKLSGQTFYESESIILSCVMSVTTHRTSTCIHIGVLKTFQVGPGPALEFTQILSEYNIQEHG